MSNNNKPKYESGYWWIRGKKSWMLGKEYIVEVQEGTGTIRWFGSEGAVYWFGSELSATVSDVEEYYDFVCKVPPPEKKS